MSNIYQELKSHNEELFIKNFLSDLIKSRSMKFNEEEIKEIKNLEKKLNIKYKSDLLSTLTSIEINDSSVFWYDLLNLKTQNLSLAINSAMSQLRERNNVGINSLAHVLLKRLNNDNIWDEQTFLEKFKNISNLPKKSFENTLQAFIEAKFFHKLDENKQLTIINQVMNAHSSFFYAHIKAKSHNQVKHKFFNNLLTPSLYQKVFSISNLIANIYPQIRQIEKKDSGSKPNIVYRLDEHLNTEQLCDLLIMNNLTENDIKKIILTSQPFLYEVLEHQGKNKLTINNYFLAYNKIANEMNYEIIDIKKPESLEKIKLEALLSMPKLNEKKLKI